MQGLLSKLAGMDSSTERALRIVEFYDQLVLHHADLEAVVRASAILAECTAGAVYAVSGEIRVVGPDGAVLAPRQNEDALIQPIAVNGVVVGHAWISRGDSEAREWDELVVVRMSLALASLHSRETESSESIGLADPAIAHVLLRESASEIEAARAARLLGFPIGQRIRLVALNTGDSVAVSQCRQILEESCGVRAVAAAIGEQLSVVILATDDALPVALPGVVAAMGPAATIENCAASWVEARTALRFAALGGSWPSFVQSGDIGSFLALVHLDSGSVSKISDVQRIAQIAAEGGRDDLELLDRLTTTTSLRGAATTLYMHHSSAAYRVTRLSERLGFDLRDAENKLRARLALVLWQLHCAKS